MLIFCSAVSGMIKFSLPDIKTKKPFGLIKGFYEIYIMSYTKIIFMTLRPPFWGRTKNQLSCRQCYG